MQHALRHPVRMIRAKGRDERGLVTIVVSLFIVALLLVTAVVVDVGNARQQKREASAAADAGALGGAKSLDTASYTPSRCNDSNCVGAYYALASAHNAPTNVSSFTGNRHTCTQEPVYAGETCWQYEVDNMTVDVKNPYRLQLGTPDLSLVHVKICWPSTNTFGRVTGVNSFTVCGSATARNTGLGSNSAANVAADCSAEDNFANSSDTPQVFVFNPGDYPTEGGKIDFTKGNKLAKNNEILAVLFDGFGTDINLSSIVFSAPTTVSGPLASSVNLSRIIPTDNKGPESPQAHGIGYTVQSLDSLGKLQPYTPGGTYRAVIAYQLPDDAHLKVNGQTYLYTAKLYAADSVQNPGPNCGNATWKFTHDGKTTTSSIGGCGENSFLALGQFPATGKATPGDMVGAYYTDESPLQTRDVTDPYWSTQTVNAGIDFELRGGAFTDANGNDYQIPPASTTTGGYTIGPLPGGMSTGEKYNNTIKWQLPPASDPRWVNGYTYTAYLKAYDTDQNKPGNDCGVAEWSFVLTGATGTGIISLVE